MARILKEKELVNTRLATNYGGWMYCDKCGENIGYLCYSTYDNYNLIMFVIVVVKEAHYYILKIVNLEKIVMRN